MTWHVAIRDYECTVYTWQVVLLALVVLGVAWLLRQPGHGETALGGLSKKPSGPDHYPATDARTLLIIVGVSQGATRKNLGGQRLNTEIVTFLGQNAEWLWYGASDQEPPLTVLSPASAKDSTAMYWLRIRTNQRIEALEKNRTLPALKDALNQMADGGAKVEGTGGPVPLSVFTNFTRL